MSAYGRRHDRVRKARGKASEHPCACGRLAQEWATIHGCDGESPDDYEAMCCSCHGKYDDHWSEETRAKLSNTLKKLWEDDPTLRASALGNRNAAGERSPEARANIKEGSQVNVGNKYASGKRTPEQRARIRAGRWGGDQS